MHGVARPGEAGRGRAERGQARQGNVIYILQIRQALTMGGTLGLGTFRPYFGRYELTVWDPQA